MPRLLGQFEVVGQAAHQDDVHRLGGASFLGQSQAVKGVHLGAGGLHLLHQIFGVLGRAGDDGHRIDLLGRGDNLSIWLQVGQPAGGLQQLEGHDIVRFSLVNDGGAHLFPVAHIGNHASAPLGHAVDLGHLHVIALLHQQVAQQLAG